MHKLALPLLVLVCWISLWSAQAAPDKQVPAGPEFSWLTGNGLRLKTAIYRSTKLSDHPTLIVVLHGDLLGVRLIPKSTYHYDFAQQAAGQMDDVVIAAVLRPGYRDHTGERSQGEMGLTTGDNYTAEVVDAIAQVVDQLKARFHPAHTLLTGHSGGAAISADLLGRWPATVNAALLVSCPCDLTAWRKYMMEKQDNNPIWTQSIHSLSPLDLAQAGKVAPTVLVRLLVGSKDDVAPPELSQRYAEALRSHNVDATVNVVPGLEHNILLEPVAFQALKDLAATEKKYFDTVSGRISLTLLVPLISAGRKEQI